MIADKDLKICRELKDRLSREVNLLDIRVFGSRARGDNDPDSDLDVFIEVDRLTREAKEKIQYVAWEVGIDNGCIFISPLIFDKKELTESPMRSSWIVENIYREGIPV
jgi:predicted nucleotidyltransferase